MKYIIVDLCSFRFPVIFPDMLTHSDVGAGLVASKMKILSAGFCSLEPRVLTHGHSESLKLSPQPDDAALIETFVRCGDAALTFVNHSIQEVA